jgi:hypothetical protein
MTRGKLAWVAKTSVINQRLLIHRVIYLRVIMSPLLDG